MVERFTVAGRSSAQVLGMDNLYVCDMFVMPFSSAAKAVRTWPRWPCASPTTSSTDPLPDTDRPGQS